MPPFTQRPQDEERPEEQLTLQLFNRPLTIGGEVDTKLRYREDLSLGRRDDDDSRLSLGLQLEFLYRLTPNTSFYFEIDSSYQTELYTEDNDTESTGEIEIGEWWIYLKGFGNYDLISMQIGRQYFGDQREWWWDKKLDAVRVQYTGDTLKAQFSIGVNPTTISTENDDLNPEDENIIWLLASINWEWTKKNYFEAFYLFHFDHSTTPAVGAIIPAALEDEEDAVINWFGLRSRGKLKKTDLGRLHYWLDSGIVYGKETQIDFDKIGNNQSLVSKRRERSRYGWGLDVGATWETKLPYQPRLTFGYAIGSGDADPNDDMNRAYRQSGLQSNDDKFRGVNSFRYYGELLRPELSNLNIQTVALGFPLLKDSSVELVYHRYMQIYATDQLRNSRLRTDPAGEYRDIGEEFNIILGLEESKQWEFELIAAQFRAGKAYGKFSGRAASSINFQAEYNF